jgi:hypothetical protein
MNDSHTEWINSRGPASSMISLNHRQLDRQQGQLRTGVWPGAPRATESRAGHKANPSTAAAVAVGSYRVARLLLHGLPVYLRCLLAIGLLRRPRPGLLVVDTSSAWVAGRPGWHRVSLEHIEASSLPAPSSGLCDEGRRPSLVRYDHVVGTHRWPGSPSLPRSARVGRTPIALWSDVVVSHAVAEALGVPMRAEEKDGRAYETDGFGVACC